MRGEARREGARRVQLPEGKRRILWIRKGCRQLKQRSEETRVSDRYCRRWWRVVARPDCLGGSSA